MRGWSNARIEHTMTLRHHRLTVLADESAHSRIDLTTESQFTQAKMELISLRRDHSLSDRPSPNPNWLLNIETRTR